MTETLSQITLSASSLTQLDICARRFRYLYLDRLIWPVGEGFEGAVELQRGKVFHRLVELHSRGRRVDPLLGGVDAAVRAWWQVFSQSPHSHPSGSVLSELPIWTEIEGFRLTARLDRLVVSRSSLHICDWKTERHRPLDTQVRQSWQVRLYPLLVCRAGALLSDQDGIPPGSVRLTVWYASHPERPFTLIYSQNQLDKDLDHLRQALDRLRALSAQGYPMTTKLESCQRCLFRSRCYGLVPDVIEPEQLALFEWLSAQTEDPE